MPPGHGHTIRVVARRTGLSQHVIRVWERRYGAVEPSRTPTNRRLYSDADVEKLRLLSVATQSGHSIGQIARLSSEELGELIQQDVPSLPALPPVEPVEPRDPGDYVDSCLDAVKRLDATTLEVELSRAAVDLSHQTLIGQVIEPLMDHIGQGWQDGDLRIADEHLASAVVRTFVGGLKELQQVAPTGPGIVVTTPAGQLHEIGALTAAATASAIGWRVAYLGPNLPAEEICGAARRHGVRAVGLSIIYPSDDPQMSRELLRLRRGLEAGVEILVGGRAAASYAGVLQQIQATHVTSIDAMRERLLQLSGKAIVAS